MAGKLEKSKTELVAVVVVVVVLPCTECRDTGAGALHGGGHPDVLVVLLLGLLLLELGGEGEGVPVGEPLGGEPVPSSQASLAHLADTLAAFRSLGDVLWLVLGPGGVWGCCQDQESVRPRSSSCPR